MKVIGAGKFKAQCLALLDEVALEHETIVVTKHGKPVAKVTPVAEREKDLMDQLKGSILREKDLVSPLRERWEAAS
ncbi:MAG: type II toxin-antitoxin system Phd/YefM family antitoxin [Nitrospirae bacterium]|nr:type II toxin-antitoxin system Phd/YefM family antitoxin [Nitrospirota bacterium]